MLIYQRSLPEQLPEIIPEPRLNLKYRFETVKSFQIPTN